MGFDIWRPLHMNDIPQEKYVYHYTTFESAIKIMYSGSLLFSCISKTNDTTESKRKIAFDRNNIDDPDTYRDMVTSITDYFTHYSNNIQLLCLSIDRSLSDEDKEYVHSRINTEYTDDIYYDVSGRGFALPRMWAQYAENNCGVCFVINRKKLLKIVEQRIEIFKSAKVDYKNYYDRYFISKDEMKKLYRKISMMSNGGLSLFQMIQNDPKFLMYNFFEKSKDWENEQEYRIIAVVDSSSCPEHRIAIDQLPSYLEGVVIGENMPDSYEQVIRSLAEPLRLKRDRIKRIKFGERICKLK